MESESLRSEAAVFDALAESYDADFTASAVGRALRARVWERLDTLFASRESLLELGCGTGEDAIHLALRGHRILATDASAEMISVAQRKAERAGVADRIRFICAPMESLTAGLGDETFDGVYSNFGAVNCATDMATLARALARHLAPDAPLLFVAMGRYVPWEWAWFLARGDRARAFRRLAPGGAEWRGLQIHYPTPATLARELAPWFAVTRRFALGFALPPSYAAGWLETAPRRFAMLGAVERATCRFTANLSDHYILEAVRT